MIKYECDVCGKLVNPAEAFGPEVDGGKSLEWVYTDSEADLAIGVFPFRRTDLELRPEGGFCKECVGKALAELVYSIFPMMIAKKWVVVKADENNPGSSGADSHLRKVRTEPGVSEPSPDDGSHADIYHSPGTGPDLHRPR